MLGTVCMTGVFDKNKSTFTAHKDTKMGTVTRKSMLQICGIDDPSLLTRDVVSKNSVKLKAKLLPKVKQNLNALYNQLIFVSGMPKDCHVLRISSDLLPMFDHPVLGSLYDTEFLSVVDILLSRCKKVIDTYNIVVSTHPDQFVIINSVGDDVRKQAYITLHYHKYFMERLTTSDKSCINIHLEGNLDHLPEFDSGLHLDLIPWLSFENSDKNGKIFTGDTNNTLDICEKYGIKMLYDCHHHIVMTGEYVDFGSDTFKRILSTWGSQTPFFHVSQSRESDVVSRTHSDFIEDQNVIEQAKFLSSIGYLEVEAKAKTSAVLDLFSKIS